MIKYIKRMIFAWQYKQAVNEAVRQNRLTGLKYYVVLLSGRLRVLPKRTIKELIRRRRFIKGTTVQDIERHALFVTA